MTAEEVQARVSKSKRELIKPKIRCGVAAALDLREEQMVAAGKETTLSKKRKKKDKDGNTVQEAMKAVKGGHHLLK